MPREPREETLGAPLEASLSTKRDTIINHFSTVISQGLNEPDEQMAYFDKMTIANFLSLELFETNLEPL